MRAPASRAARATAGFMVSIEIGTLTWEASSSITGRTRRSSSASGTGSAPGRVDSPPTSRISAPRAASSSAWRTAAAASRNFPPSEKESGVTLTIPMTNAGRGKRNSNWRARKSMLLIQQQGWRPPAEVGPPAAWRRRPAGTPGRSNLGSKIRNRLLQSLRQRHLRFPVQNFSRLGNVGAALFGIVLRQRFENDSAPGTGGANDFPGELQHRQFRRVADVHGQIVIAHHQPVDAFDQVGNVTEAAGLSALAEDGDGLVFERLTDEGRHDAAIVKAHPRAVGVEDAHDARLDFVFAMVGHGQRLGEPLGLVVTAARADGVDVAPVFLGLWMDERVAINLGRGSQQEPRPFVFGQAERLVRAQRADLQRLNRKIQIVKRAGR